MQVRERRKRWGTGDGEGTLTASVVGASWLVQEELRRRALTVAELAEATGLPERRTRRLVHALIDAGLPVEAVARPQPGTRAPTAYRLRVRA